jgi:hypothetical protein
MYRPAEHRKAPNDRKIICETLAAGKKEKKSD